MLLLTQFELPFFDNFTIKGEYEGNEKSGKVIIFSHGFGVDRTDRGLFTAIGDFFKDNFLILRFDYNKVIPEKNTNYIFPPSLQAKMLEQVYQYSHKTFSPFHFTLISHSLGCIIACLADVAQLDAVILLSPPLNAPFTTLKQLFSKRTGSEPSLKEISVIERSDGSITYVPPEFSLEVKNINPLNLYRNILTKTSIYAIHPLQDENLKNEPYDKLQQLLRNKYYEQIGDHNFSLPPHRQKLLDTIQQIVGGK